jgi:predicted RNase H-like HicB family nuclease
MKMEMKMKTFFALVHKDADSAYGISFPDLPGCFSAADEADDILPQASEALSLWFDNTEEVSPRSMEEIAGACAEDLARGAALLAVPRVTTSGKPTRVNLSMDRGMLAAIDAAAAARKLTRSGFLVEAARNEIEGVH